ncbi:MAG: hypothetical protein Q4B60_00740 [Erysipelotrichaceae bacterium]|nr:hypothetical protein [Erysipelotrichaceae bacterium]
MKKIIIFLLTGFLALSLAACKSKEEIKEEKPNTSSENINNTLDSNVEIDGDPIQYSMDYWQEKFPGKNICPFYIEENGVEYPYFLVMEFGCTMNEWIETGFNWNGWHKLGDDIVNGDETLKIVSQWVGEEPEYSFSSSCTVNTVPVGTGSMDIYNFDGYTNQGSWPSAEEWAKWGIPDLHIEDVGYIEISGTDWIGGLEAEEGIMYDAEPETSHIEEFVNILNENGIYGDGDLSSEYTKNYIADYEFNGEAMRITILEFHDASLQILLEYHPAPSEDY